MEGVGRNRRSIHTCNNLDLDLACLDWDEYCEAQRFSPTCGPEHVIVVTEAWYGRQRLGKCVKVDYGYVGCYADVLNHLDGACSGRRSCTVAIPDASLDLSNTCPKEFKTYLNASYICVEGKRIKGRFR